MRGGGRDSKIDPAPIVHAHFATLVDAASGRPHLGDYLVQVGLPAGAGLAAWGVGVRISAATGAALLTLAGLFAAFLFQLVVQLLDRAASWSDERPDPGPITSRYAGLLSELSANAAYAGLVAALLATASLGVAISSAGWQERALGAAALALLVHLAMTLLMVTRRVFLVTASRLRDVRTGAHREN